jgi:AraC-like DNA-binding protein/Flp pilus assembly protein TadD
MNQYLPFASFQSLHSIVRKFSFLFALLVLLPSGIYSSPREVTNQDIRTLYEEAFKYDDLGDKKNALLTYYQILNKTKDELNQDVLLIRANSFNKAAIILYNQGDFVRSLEFFLSSKRIHKELNNESGIIEMYNNIGTIYFVWDEYDRAMEYYLQALELLKPDTLSIRQMSLVENNIGLIYYKQGDYKKALSFLLHSLETLRGENPNHVFHHLTNIGSSYLMLRNFSEAKQYYYEALAVGEEINNLNFVSSAYSSIGNTMLEWGQYEQARDFFQLSIDIAIEEDYKDILFRCYLALSRLYETIGDHQTSLDYHKKYMIQKNLVFNAEKHKQIQELQLLYETEIKDKEILFLNSEKELRDQQIAAKNRILFLLILGFVLIGSLLVVVYSQKKVLEESNQELVRKNLEIVASERKNSKKPIEAAPLSLSSGEAFLPKDVGFSRDSSVLNKPASPTEIIQSNTLRVDFEASNRQYEACLSAGRSSSALVPEDQRGPLMEAIKDVMENSEEYLKSNFTIDKLATLVKSNKRYVSQIINDEFNQSYNSFINSYRIRVARRLLSDDEYQNYTIEAIANMVGFKSKSSFNVFFKKSTGITPSYFQKNVRTAFYKSKSTVDA